MNTRTVDEHTSNLQESNTKSNIFLQKLLQESQQKTVVVKEEIDSKLETIRNSAGFDLLSSRLPTTKDEDWRFTDLSELISQPFYLAKKEYLEAETIKHLFLPETKDNCLVFINGFYAKDLSTVSATTSGLYMGNLGNFPEVYLPEAFDYLTKENGEKEVFTSLNASGLTDAGVIWLQPKCIVENPIHVLHLSVLTEDSTFSQPRLLVVAEENSQVELVEHYHVINENCSNNSQSHRYFTNAVTQIYLGKNAKVNHTRLQQEGLKAFHIGNTTISQQRDSSYTCNEISLGSKLYRHNLEVIQEGEQTETYLNGLTTVSGDQIADTHSKVGLTKPHGTVNQLHKCILDGKAKIVFNGKILVPQAAQLTNAAQLNSNLVISPNASVNTKPELQITADNVKCSHGATISQLEADEVFYLRSRGLNETNARYLLIDAFAGEIINGISIESLKLRLNQCISCRA